MGAASTPPLRPRHGFLWQRWCVEALQEGLGDAFIGTSNVLLAMDNDLEAIGTHAHELPMVLRVPNPPCVPASDQRRQRERTARHGNRFMPIAAS